MLTDFSLKLLEPPDPEAAVVTLDQAKTQCRGIAADGSEDDFVTDILIPAATAMMEAYLRRALITQTWRLVLAQFPVDDVIDLPRPPVQSLAAFTYVDPNGDTQTVSGGVYSLDTVSFPGRIVRAYATVWPFTRWQRNSVTVDFVAGFGDAADDVPIEIRHAILMQIGDLYRNRESTIVGSPNAVQLNPTAAALVARWRFLSFD
jgi:uncharacterized phiE125 gp8 family phage protein